MKRLLLVFAGLLVGLTQAQMVDWNRVRASCFSEISAYDAVRGTGDTSSQAIRYLATEAASPAKLRDLLEKQRASLSDAYLMKTPLFRNSALMYVCAATAALNQLQNGSTRSNQAAPPAASALVARQEPDGEDATQCVKGRLWESAIFNGCRKGVNLVWCAIPKGDATPNVNCELQQFSAASLSPGERVSVEDNFVIAWTMCDAPKQVVDVRYVGYQLPG